MEQESSNNESAKEPVCEVCKKKFKNQEKLSLHMRFHSLFGNFKKTPTETTCLHEPSSQEAIDGK